MSLTLLGKAAALNKSLEVQSTVQPPAQPRGEGAAAETTPPEAQPRGVPSGEEAKAGFVGQLLAYIPADALAAYVAITAFVIDASSFWHFVSLLGVIVATPVWVVLAYRDATEDAAVLHRWPLFQMIVGAIAFVAWSASVPGSWWQADLDLSAQAGGGIAVATSILLGLVVRYYQQQHRVPRFVGRT